MWDMELAKWGYLLSYRARRRLSNNTITVYYIASNLLVVMMKIAIME